MQQGKWDFKTIWFNSPGKWKVDELSKYQETRLELYEQVLLAAEKTQVPRPDFSDYFVRTGVGNASQAFSAGNIEYGCCSAIHGEEGSIPVLRSQAGRNHQGPLAIGFVNNREEGVTAPPRPCGNCRDVTLEDLGKDFEFVSGSMHGGQALVVPVKHYLHDVYQPVEIAGAPTSWGAEDALFVKKRHSIYATAREALRRAGFEGNNFYTAKVPQARKYSAAIVTERGAWYFGSHDVMCDYHPLYAGRDAVRQAWRAKDLLIKYVVVVVDDCSEVPHVMYKDRQHLLEVNEYAELWTGEDRNPPVYLLSFKKGAPQGVWQTTVKEWLPFPFTPRAFGSEFVVQLAQKLEQRMGKFKKAEK